jgi:hypothetical protein
VEIIRRLYRMFVVQRRSESEIATVLNGEGRLTDLGRPWTRGTVHQVLTNEKYIGNNVYNRSSFKLKAKRVVNDPDNWVRRDGAFEGIVEPDFFEAAQRIIQARCVRYSDEELLARLSDLLAKKGWLSGLVIDEVDDMPSSSAFRHRFGSLVRAYQLIGYSPARDYRYIEANRILRVFHGDEIERVIGEVTRLGGSVARNPTTDLLTINAEFTASVVIARCRETSSGGLRWKIRFDTGLAPDITVAVRMDRSNTTVLDYYLLPQFEMRSKPLGLSEENGLMLDAFRFETLDFFFDIARRVPISEVAPW